ncbi:LysR family transcriptional regulator [Pelomonas sp. KK5]|uniref:LysR family transcriptional regulator n=1 Tax=Pelomonas sp. KK5 TaxID=1855730 RepID=UPI00097C4EBE|nr:LysR family transcriptional regulator [Pelomonas sp. KK5]
MDERMLGGLGVFLAIADAGSFAEAGRQLDMSQPGVSRAVARLEQRLGVRLFDRTTRSVSLTDEGRAFRSQVLPLLAGLEEAANGVALGRTAVRGRLRVQLDPFFSRMALGPRIGEFLAAHPELRLDLVTRDQLGDMVADGFDLAVRFGHLPASGLIARKLLDTRIVTVAAPAYLARRGRPAAPQDIEREGHACIDFRDPATGRPFPWEFHRRRRRLVVPTDGRLIVNDAGTLLSTCLAGYGLAQVMDFGTRSLLETGSLVDLFPDWPDERFPMHAIYPSRHQVPAKVRAFLAFVVGIVGEGRMNP